LLARLQRSLLTIYVFCGITVEETSYPQNVNIKNSKNIQQGPRNKLALFQGSGVYNTAPPLHFKGLQKPFPKLHASLPPLGPSHYALEWRRKKSNDIQQKPVTARKGKPKRVTSCKLSTFPVVIKYTESA
jgi:hypothetical protein